LVHLTYNFRPFGFHSVLWSKLNRAPASISSTICEQAQFVNNLVPLLSAHIRKTLQGLARVFNQRRKRVSPLPDVAYLEPDALAVRSQPLKVQSFHPNGTMRYGPGFSRQRYDDGGAPSSDTASARELVAAR
jgi:hypothetical protein